MVLAPFVGMREFPRVCPELQLEDASCSVVTVTEEVRSSLVIENEWGFVLVSPFDFYGWHVVWFSEFQNSFD